MEAGYAAVDLAERLCSARVIDRLAPLAAAAQAVHTIDAADPGNGCYAADTMSTPPSAPTASAGGLTLAELPTVVGALCDRVGLDPTGAQLIKFTNNAALRLATAPVVVRIAGSRAARASITTVV